MTVSGQTTIAYEYDAANRLVKVEQAAGASNGNRVKTTTITYDPGSRRTKIILPSGLRQSYAYDSGDQLVSIEYRNSSNGLIGDVTYGYDAAGRRKSVGGTLAAEKLPDAVSSATYNANNQIQSWNGSAYTYDLNGMLVSDGTNSYAWDARKMLVGVSGAVTATFQYDASGRRIGKVINGASTGYVYDGLSFVQELSSSSPAANVTANLLVLGMDEVLDRRAGGVDHGFLADGRGSVIGEIPTDATGASTLFEYDPFGNSSSSSSTGNTQAFTGREQDIPGLYFYRARYYQPQTGHFISEDPLSWASGQFNDYAYVGNNPINFVDPLGLACVDTSMLIQGTISGAFAAGEMFTGWMLGMVGAAARNPTWTSMGTTIALHGAISLQDSVTTMRNATDGGMRPSFYENAGELMGGSQGAEIGKTVGTLANAAGLGKTASALGLR